MVPVLGHCSSACLSTLHWTAGAGSLEATGSTACDAGPAAAWGCSAAHTGVEEIVVKETGFYDTLDFLVFVNNMLRRICL